MESRSGARIFGRGTSIGLAFALSLLLIGTVAPGVRAAGPPTLTIVTPANDAVIGNGSPVAIAFIASNINLTEPGMGVGDPNAGHVEVFVDGILTRLTAETSLVLPLASGRHDIRLRLVADNGTGFNPDVNATVAVTSTRGPAGGVPGIQIMYPRDDERRGPDTAVSFRLTNFALVPPGGPAGVPNEGHVEVFLDGILYQELTVYEPVHFSDLPEGDHTATLRLVDNAHNPLTPDVAASVRFHVVSPGIFDISPELAVTNTILAALVIVALFYPIRKGKP